MNERPDLVDRIERDTKTFQNTIRLRDGADAKEFLEANLGNYADDLAEECALYDRVLCYLDTSKPEIFRDIVKTILGLGFERQEVVDFINAKLEKAKADRMNEAQG